MAHLYQNAGPSRIQNYEHSHGAEHKLDPNWGSHSALLAQRRAQNPIQGRPHDHAFNNNVGMEPIDPRIAANHARINDPGLNPAITATRMMGVEQMPGSDPTLNPAFDTLFAPLPSQAKPTVAFEDDNEGEIPVTEIQTGDQKTVIAKPKGRTKGKEKAKTKTSKKTDSKKKLAAAV